MNFVLAGPANEATYNSTKGTASKMPSAITGTPYLAASPTGYTGVNNQLGQAIQTIWSTLV